MSAILYNRQASAATASGNSGPLTVGPLQYLSLGVTVQTVGGTTPKMTLYVEFEGADGVWYELYKKATVTTAGAVTTSVGPGAATPGVLTNTVRLRWALTGTSPSFTFSASLIAR